MSWNGIYRLALLLLPAELRRKHGPAMEALFARELERARAQGRSSGTAAGAAGLWDVLRRAAYECVRRLADSARELGGTPSPQQLNVHAPSFAGAGANPGDHRMQTPSTRQLLRRHAVAFAVAFLSLTVVLLAIFMSRQWPELASRGLPNGDIARVLLLAVPFTAAMTIPMAVFVGVLWVFARLGSLGSLAVARQERDGVRRLLVPVLGAAAVVAGLTLVWNSEVVPRANDRLVAVREAGSSASPARSDRAMTAGELRAAERRVRSEGGPDASRLAARYEVEFQKKFALAAACVLLALAGAATALRFPRGGTWLVIVASVAVFGAYYFCMVTGETLADRMAVSPFIAMWSANGLLLAGALLLLPRGRGRASPHGTEPAVIGG